MYFIKTFSVKNEKEIIMFDIICTAYLSKKMEYQNLQDI